MSPAEISPLAENLSGSESAPAKINLDLLITGKRLDGYHELDSLVVFTAFGDRLDFQHAEAFSLTVSGPFANDVPRQDNIIIRAAELLRTRFPQARPLAFHLHKNLPVASGIGGGSSDAAAALRAMVRENALEIDAEHLRDLGSSIGSDIPVCLFGHPVRMRGTGSRLDPVRALPEMALVLVNPGIKLSTADVFAKREGAFLPSCRPALPIGPSPTGFAVWLQSSRNDLEGIASQLEPVIEDVKQSLMAQDGCLIARMSGSGATCFGFFQDAKRADRAATLIKQNHPEWWVAATRTLS